MEHTALIPVDRSDVTLRQLGESAREYVRHSKAPRTIKAYDSDWRDFQGFCRRAGFATLPATPETVALYLAAMADEGHKPATMTRRLAALSKMHSAAGFLSPTSMKHAAVAETWAGIRRVKGTRQNAKAAATTNYLRRMLETVPNSLAGLRDRALLLLGFAAALRRSELVALDVTDVQYVPEGMLIRIRKSKTDQEAAGETLGVHSGRTLSTCPVRSLREWLAAARIESGPIFRSITRHGHVGHSLTDQVVALRVKKYAQAAGLDHSLFSGHSLRAGLATASAIAGADERKIMDQTRHKSVAMVRRYIREGNVFRDNVTAKLGL